jgi:hypothetical protein
MGCDDIKDYYYRQEEEYARECIVRYQNSLSQLQQIERDLPRADRMTPPRIFETLATLQDMVRARIAVLQERYPKEDPEDVS